MVYEGDYLVHENIGVCRFKRVLSSVVNGQKRDIIELEFADGTTDVSRRESVLLTRFRSADTRGIRLAKTIEQRKWLRSKEKVVAKVRQQAVDVIALYAKRAETERAPCAPDGPDYDQFCAAFVHSPTADQARSMEEIAQDMVWKRQPMDRLLCGDVGFGELY
jgi:transcription-repair coupling factor (superfamily II helicase)